MSELWCDSLGWSQERLVEACTRQMRKLAYGHLIDRRGHEPVVQLAEKLLDIANASILAARFSHTSLPIAADRSASQSKPSSSTK
jgi:4-aminobutyrate--pyruvate transaminase